MSRSVIVIPRLPLIVWLLVAPLALSALFIYLLWLFVKACIYAIAISVGIIQAIQEKHRAAALENR